MALLNWKCPKGDDKKIEAIAKRYERLRELGLDNSSWRNLLMDITACHCNGCPLDLDELLICRDSDLGHDIGGIQRYLNRETGKLENHFVPRCAKRDTTA
jgi:hypothetical protein